MLDYQVIQRTHILEKALERCLTHPQILNMVSLKQSFEKRETLEQAGADPNFYAARKFLLKKEHSCGYYTQLQGQLAHMDLKWCDFWIYASVSNEMCTDRISYDTNYWVNQLLPIQSQFYLHLVLQFFLGWAMTVNSCDNTEDVILVDTIQTTQNLLFWGLARKTPAPWST